MNLYASNTYRQDIEQAANTVVNADILKDKTVLVTGASGLVGSCLVDVLGILGAHVIAAGRNDEAFWRRFEKSPWQPEFALLDISKPIDLDFQVDYIINGASNPDPVSITTDPVGVIEVNVGGTQRLLEWAQSHDCKRFVYISSGEVYGQMPFMNFFTEDCQGYVDPEQMRSCYPLAKRMAENLCVAWQRQHGMETLSVRLCHTYGPTAKQSDSRASSVFAYQAALAKPVEMNSAGTQVRSYLYVADAASGILSALCAAKPMHAYNVANPKSVVTIREMGERFAVAGKVPFKAASLPKNKDASPITRQVLDSSRLQSFGWAPQFSMQEGAEHTVRAFRESWA